MSTMNKEKAIERMSTSIRINPEVWKDAKIQAIKDETTVSEMLENAIREYIMEREDE